MNHIEINKFSDLHDEENIFFCKIDFILNAFQTIKQLNNKIILITGNSDYCVTDDLVSKAPANIVKWFCQNRLSDNILLDSVPMGIENTVKCKIDGHGYVWHHALEKPNILKIESFQKREISNLIYSNFKVETNPPYRSKIKQITSKLSYITKDEPNLEYKEFAKRINSHEAVLCPQGNGPGDNHRIYETLYLNKIPITFNKKLYKYLHYNFPIVCLDSFEELQSEETIRQKINEKKQLTYNKNMLEMDFWINKIKAAQNELPV